MPETPRNRCLRCDYVADHASTVEKGAIAPKPGDVALCIKCGELYIFDKELKYRVPSHRELLEFKASVGWLKVLNVRRAIEKVRQTHPWPDKPKSN